MLLLNFLGDGWELVQCFLSYVAILKKGPLTMNPGVLGKRQVQTLVYLFFQLLNYEILYLRQSQERFVLCSVKKYVVLHC
jgi:hypothetical protein